MCVSTPLHVSPSSFSFSSPLCVSFSSVCNSRLCLYHWLQLSHTLYITPSLTCTCPCTYTYTHTNIHIHIHIYVHIHIHYTHTLHIHTHTVSLFVLSLPFSRSQGGLFKSWKRRYFVLTEATLRYLEAPDSVRPKGVINLRAVSHVRAHSAPNATIGLEIVTRARVFVLRFNEPVERDAWIASLQVCVIVIGGWLPFFLQHAYLCSSHLVCFFAPACLSYLSAYLPRLAVITCLLIFSDLPIVLT